MGLEENEENEQKRFTKYSFGIVAAEILLWIIYWSVQIANLSVCVMFGRSSKKRNVKSGMGTEFSKSKVDCLKVSGIQVEWPPLRKIRKSSFYSLVLFEGALD
jgi:hypothetical protein